MTIYRHGPGWRYDFRLGGRRHVSAGSFATRDDAEEAQAKRKRTLRRQRAGLEAADASDTPRFSHWAEVTFKWQRDRKKLKRPDAAKLSLRMILAFWGAKPTDSEAVEGGVYRNLRLGDPIADPELIGEFEDWMTARKISGPRKNHYRSACSMLYRVALLPENRRKSGVRENPFLFVLRDRGRRRTAVLEPDALMRWIESAPLPVALAVGLGTLAPSLRLQNVVELRRDQLSADRRFLTTTHKADRETGLPLTVPISAGLQRVIARVEKEWPGDPYVIPLTGERYWQMVKLVKRSILAAGLPYGRKRDDGITFHSLRHMASTSLARWKVSREERQRALAHATSAMADWYEHLGGAAAESTMALIDEKLPIASMLERRLDEAPSIPVPSKTRKRARTTTKSHTTKVRVV